MIIISIHQARIKCSTINYSYYLSKLLFAICVTSTEMRKLPVSKILPFAAAENNLPAIIILNVYFDGRMPAQFPIILWYIFLWSWQLDITINTTCNNIFSFFLNSSWVRKKKYFFGLKIKMLWTTEKIPRKFLWISYFSCALGFYTLVSLFSFGVKF